MDEELKFLEREEEMQMKLEFEEKEKMRQERLLEEEELQILEGEEEMQMKLRFEEKGKMRQEQEQRVCPSNLTEQEKISQDVNKHENLELIRKRRRHYSEPTTPERKLSLNHGALEIGEKNQVLTAVDPQDLQADEQTRKKNRGKQVLATADQQDVQAGADKQSRKKLLAEWKEEVQRIEDKQEDWFKARFEEETEKMRLEKEPPSDLTEEQKKIRLAIRFAESKSVPRRKRSDRARKWNKFQLWGLTEDEKRIRSNLKRKIRELESKS